MVGTARRRAFAHPTAAAQQQMIANSLRLYQTKAGSPRFFYFISMKGHGHELHLARHQGSEAGAA
jgi:hypothetical protein